MEAASNIPSVDALAISLAEAKEQADLARARVIEIEAEIVSIFGNQREGAENFEGVHYTLQTVGVLNRKIEDVDSLRECMDPDTFDIIVKYKPSLDVAGLKKLAVSDPASYRAAARWISEKSGKTAVKIKEAK